MILPEHRRMYAQIPKSKKNKVIEYLRPLMTRKIKRTIREAIYKDNDNWCYNYGDWANAVKNMLRKKGYTETFFRIQYYDDIFPQLIEELIRTEKGL